jgi:uncharacterized RDD family membrane protein YckC
MRIALLRIVAWMIDCAVILVWVGVVAAVGVPLYLADMHRVADPLPLNIVGALTLIVPATIVMAALEASSRHATFGKRVMRLHVADAHNDAPLRFPRALARNALKIALPWLIAHAAVIELVQSNGQSTLAIVLLSAAYVLPILYVAMLFAPAHRTAYDRISRTAASPVRSLSAAHASTSP